MSNAVNKLAKIIAASDNVPWEVFGDNEDEYLNNAQAILAAIQADPLAYVKPWQPIETALPKDLDKALLLDDGEPVVGEYLEGQEMWFDQEIRGLHSVTHWMPLPPAPKENPNDPQ